MPSTPVGSTGVVAQHLAAQDLLVSDLTDEEQAELERLLRKLEMSIQRNAQGARSAPVAVQSGT